MNLFKIEHEGNFIEVEDLKDVKASDVLANDFLNDSLVGPRHIVLRSVSPNGNLLTFWDCDAVGHVYKETAAVDIYRPTVIDKELREWSSDDCVNAWHDFISRSKSDKKNTSRKDAH